MHRFRGTLILTVSLAALSLGACTFAPQNLPEFKQGRADEPVSEDAVFASLTPFSLAEDGTDAEPEQTVASPAGEEDNGEFDIASITDDAQLSEMRGGFVSVGGLMINFGLVSSTSVNDIVVNKLELSTVGLNGLLPSNLQQLLQNGSGNQAAVPSSAVPYNVLTVVQNTASNQVIQNQNVLDITVGNLAAFRNQQIAFSQRFAVGGR